MQNVRFVLIKDRSGFPHIFWKCIREVPAGDTIWGDYGDAYWESEDSASAADLEVSDGPIVSAMMRRLLQTLRGCAAAFPLAVECGVGGRS